MAENILIGGIVLICLLFMLRHFLRQVKGKGCDREAGNATTPLQRKLPDLRADHHATSRKKNLKPDAGR